LEEERQQKAGGHADVQDGRRRPGFRKARNSDEVLARFANGQPVTITYVSGNPQVTKLPGDRPHVGGFMTLLGIGLLGFAAWKALFSGTPAR
jgi:hypothetical protein